MNDHEIISETVATFETNTLSMTVTTDGRLSWTDGPRSAEEKFATVAEALKSFAEEILERVAGGSYVESEHGSRPVCPTDCHHVH